MVPSFVGVKRQPATAAVARTRSGTSGRRASVTERMTMTNEPSLRTRCVPTRQRSRALHHEKRTVRMCGPVSEHLASFSLWVGWMAAGGSAPGDQHALGDGIVESAVVAWVEHFNQAADQGARRGQPARQPGRARAEACREASAYRPVSNNGSPTGPRVPPPPIASHARVSSPAPACAGVGHAWHCTCLARLGRCHDRQDLDRRKASHQRIAAQGARGPPWNVAAGDGHACLNAQKRARAQPQALVALQSFQTNEHTPDAPSLVPMELQSLEGRASSWGNAVDDGHRQRDRPCPPGRTQTRTSAK